MKNLNLKSAILSTLSFFNLYKHPLSLEEIQQYLLAGNFNLEEIKLYLLNSPKITYREPFFYLDENKDDLKSLRLRRKELVNKYLNKTKKLAPFMASLPFLRFIGICNNMAWEAISDDSDIDLFVIAKKNRLFTARFFLTLLLHLLGQRRHDLKIKGRYCLSFFISENALNLQTLELKPYDIYLAYWIKTLKPIFGEQPYQIFLDINKIWLNKYFSNNIQYKSVLYKENRLIEKIKHLFEKMLSGKFGDFIENKLKNWQIKRALNKQEKVDFQTSGIIIRDDILKFHNFDRRPEILKNWKTKVTNLISYSEQKAFEEVLRSN